MYTAESHNNGCKITDDCQVEGGRETLFKMRS